MKFSINKTELQNAVSIVLKGLSTRSTLPALSGILINASNDRLVLQSTDLELSIQYSAAALVEEEGKTVVPGKLFSEIIKNLADAAVYVEVGDGQAYIECDSASFSLKVLNPEDFPEFPQVDIQQKIEVPFLAFSSMVKRVSRVVSRDETRAILTGVLVTLEDGQLRMVATDSYRLAVTQEDLPQTEAADFQAVIDGTFLSEIASLPKTEAAVSLALAENQIVVSCEEVVFINRRIEGNFPNYKQLLPDNCTTRVSVDIDKLVAGIKRVSLMGSSSVPIKFDINQESQTMQISATAQDVGSAQEILSCEMEGEDAQIAFNASYVLGGLSAASGQTLNFEIQSPQKPGIFRTQDDNSYLYLVMPVRLS